MSRACFETSSDGLADVIQCLGLGASLGYAARNGRALSNEHACLIGLQRHEQLHNWILLHLAPHDEGQDISDALVNAGSDLERTEFQGLITFTLRPLRTLGFDFR